ncbi:hypothetical protein ABZ958_07690 [Streptomyces sp. NPDC046237]|uniref:hypothetical protein n=1 Tax=Streptomyces sp. NPDC046237 TaxID=3154914 RepID=UPI0033CEF1B2
MPWPAGNGPYAGPSVPLLISGSVVTAAGTLMYFVLWFQSPLFGCGALVLASTAAAAVSARGGW